MTDIYIEGFIPSIVVSGSVVEVLKATLVPGAANTLVAISHVRSEGLGNWLSNSLPLCQLSQLQGLVNNLYPSSHHPVPFWIDTACIPLTAPGDALALEALNVIYKHADVVLALDAAILKSVATLPGECLLQIKKSAWAQRLWTIREGALAKSLHFQFGSTAVDLDEIIRQYSASSDQNLPLADRTTVQTTNGQLPFMTEESNAMFLELCLMLERDLRAALGKVVLPSLVYEEAGRSVSTEQLHEFHTIIRQCYFSTRRYRYFWDVSQRSYIEGLQRIIEGVYRGINYSALLEEQKISLTNTFERLDEVYLKIKQLGSIS